MSAETGGEKGLRFFVGTHDHKHGLDVYLFRRLGDFSESDFVTYLGDAYEPDASESVEVFEPVPQDI